MLRICAWGCGERSSLQYAMRGREMSSAKRVCPVTLARASTRRRGTPITRSSLPFASEFALRIVAGFGRSDIFARDFFFSADLKDRGFDGLKDLQIAGATAQVAGKRFANLIAARMWVVIQQSFGGDQNRRSAVSALRRAQIREGILQGMKFSFGAEPLHRQHALAVTLQGEQETGKHGLTVHQNGAGAALAELAAMLRAGVAQILAKDFQQSFIRSERQI